MLHLILGLFLWIILAVLAVQSKLVKSDRGLMIVGGSAIFAVILMVVIVVVWAIWLMMKAQI